MGLIFLALILASGCSDSGDPVGSVSGKITLKGKGYADCKVAVHNSQTSLTLGARVGADGTFEISKLPPGNYAFMIMPIPRETKENAGPDPPDTSPVPRKYRTRETTEFSVDVVADEVSKMDVELSK